MAKLIVTARQSGRVPYTPPALRIYGPVGSLTQSGTGATVEKTKVKMGVVTCQSNTMRALC